MVPSLPQQESGQMELPYASHSQGVVCLDNSSSAELTTFPSTQSVSSNI